MLKKKTLISWFLILSMVLFVLLPIPATAAPASSHVTESSGDGYALYNGVKLPNVESVWTDKESYPYAVISVESSASGNTDVYLTFSKSTPTYDGANCVTETAELVQCYMLENGEWVFQSVLSYTTTIVVYGDTAIWTLRDILNTDGTTYLTASDPIPLDGMNVIEWDGDTTGLERFSDNFYYVSGATDVDTNKNVVSVRTTISTGVVSTFEHTPSANSGYFELGTLARYVTTASDIYPVIGIALRIRSADYCSLFAYYPIETGGGGSGDSGETEDPDTGTINLYDYASGSLLDTVIVPSPSIIYATTTGIQITDYTTAESLYTYVWSGADVFAGFSIGNQDYVDYEVGSNFVFMSTSADIYLYGDGDVPEDPEETDPTDPTEPEATDPTEPTEDPLDKEKDEANNSGNSSVDDLTNAIPDYSKEFVDALGSFVQALSYEGTNCELVIPAVVLPGIDGLVPEFELFPVSTIDFQNVFLVFPENIVLLVRSLLTIALIIYCFKELYDTISYFLTLKKGE